MARYGAEMRFDDRRESSLDYQAHAKRCLMDKVLHEAIEPLLDAGPTVVNLKSEVRPEYSPMCGMAKNLRIECDLQAVRTMQVTQYERPMLPVPDFRPATLGERWARCVNRVEKWMQDQQKAAEKRHDELCTRVAKRMQFQV